MWLFRENCPFIFRVLVTLKRLVWVISNFIACSTLIIVDVGSCSSWGGGGGVAGAKSQQHHVSLTFDLRMVGHAYWSRPSTSVRMHFLQHGNCAEGLHFSAIIGKTNPYPRFHPSKFSSSSRSTLYTLLTSF